ncbi:uncharacterized protein LOC132278795 [Cornus florida]|uniref:uncharacterized protein LOC132278795 n=1 Tax=Cornus florida TaxID=4283 RepID=UPI00289F72FF|nr:uncharacterized protein LOC132278795 [Cornus florida]
MKMKKSAKFAIPTRFPPFDDGSDVFNEEEKEAADILLELPFLIAKLEAPSRWGTKRMRSALDSPPSRPPPRRTERWPKFVVGTSSPATPLSFSVSESDDSHKKVSKTTRERGQTQNLSLEIGKANARPGQIPSLVHQQAFIMNRTMIGGYRLVVPQSANESLVKESTQRFYLTRVVMIPGIRAKAAEARKQRLMGIKGLKRYFKPIAI